MDLRNTRIPFATETTLLESRTLAAYQRFPLLSANCQLLASSLTSISTTSCLPSPPRTEDHTSPTTTSLVPYQGTHYRPSTPPSRWMPLDPLTLPQHKPKPIHNRRQRRRRPHRLRTQFHHPHTRPPLPGKHHHLQILLHHPQTQFVVPSLLRNLRPFAIVPARNQRTRCWQCDRGLEDGARAAEG